MEKTLAEEIGAWLLSEMDSRPKKRSTTYLLGKHWEVLPDVWPPDPVTRLFTTWLPFTAGSRFLEVGCGAGMTCVVAAQHGCASVVGLDINPQAAENTLLNAQRHGVSDLVTAYTSDVFDALDSSAKFDMIFSNPPQIKMAVGREHSMGAEAAALDPGFVMHRRFFRHVGEFLAQDGRIYMGANEAVGDAPELERIAAEAGFVGRKLRTEPVQIPAALIGLTPAVKAAADEHGILSLDVSMFEFRRP